MREEIWQNRELCDICETLPLMSLFDESSDAVFIFLSPGTTGRLQKSLFFCRFQGCRFAPVLLPAAKGDGDFVPFFSAVYSVVGFFLLSKRKTCRCDEAVGGIIRWFYFPVKTGLSNVMSHRSSCNVKHNVRVSN